MSVSQRKQYNVLNIVKTEYYILTVYPIGPGRTTFFLAPQAMLLNSSNGRLPLIYLWSNKRCQETFVDGMSKEATAQTL